MKKILSFLRVAVLMLNCLVGCGSKESATATEPAAPQQTEQATEAATEEAVEEATEEVTEEATEEAFGIVVTPATVSIVDIETGVAAELTYNANYYLFDTESAQLPIFVPDDNTFSAYIEDLEEEYPDMEFNDIPFFHCMVEFKSGKTAQDFWDIRYEANHGDYTSAMDITEMTTTEVDAGTLYLFDEYWTSDNVILYPYAILEFDFGSLVFYVQEFEEEGMLEMAFNHFFIDAALAG